MPDLPRGEEKVAAVRSMFDRIAPRYDLMNRLMTFGMDVRWRRKDVKSLKLPPRSIVVDVACGTGDLCREIESLYMRAVGVDMSFGMLHAARTSAPLVQADALKLPFRDGAVDGITCGFALRNVLDVGVLFAEFARVVRVGGRLAILEVSEPESALPRFGHKVYFRKVVPMVGGWLSDAEAYRYLPESTAYLPPPGELLAMLSSSGFEARSEALMMGATQLITAVRR